MQTATASSNTATLLAPRIIKSWWHDPCHSMARDAGFNPVCSFHRRNIPSESGATWNGSEFRTDQQGREWERYFSAVQDDFGNLVEVQP